MVFNVAGYLALINERAQMYMVKVLEQLNQKNPEWINSIKNDKELFNEDGTPKNLPEDKVEEKVKQIMGKDFGVYESSFEEVVALFKITEEDLKQFIIE